MFFWIVLACSGLGAWRMADSEGRSAPLWAGATLVAGYVLGTWLGIFAMLGPGVALAGAFIGLWIAKTRDDRRRGRRF